MSRLEEEKARTAILRSRVIELEDDLKRLEDAGARPNEHDEDGYEYVPVQRFAALLAPLREIANAEKAQDADPLEWATWAHDLARETLAAIDAADQPMEAERKEQSDG